jgi:hypothetical protein
MERARWLADLSNAIAEAQRLAWRLGVLEGDNEEARELYARLHEVESEVQSLRFGGWMDVRREIDPASLQDFFPGDRWLGAREG